MPSITLIIWLSLLLQATAVVMALRLIPLTKKALAWILLSCAFILMASRRTLDLLFGENLIDDPLIHDLSTRSVALIISILLVGGLFLIKRIFVQQQQDAEQIKKLSLVVEQSPSATVIFTPAGAIEYVNPKYCEITSSIADKLLGQTPFFLTTECTPTSTLHKIWNKLRQGGVWKSEFFNTDNSGKSHWVKAVISPIKNDRNIITHYIATLDDITVEKQQRKAIKQLALHDALTDLPNRSFFHRSLQQAIADARCNHQILSVLLLDINNFKEINNTLGHMTGDVILREIASRLSHVANQDDCHTLARMGGDEFLIFSTNTDADKTLQLANKLNQAILEPFTVESRKFELTVNIGYSFYPTHGKSADELIKSADVAMYAAKESPRSIIEYTTRLDAGKLKRLELSSHLRQAAEENEFILYYQPQMQFNNGNITGAEALVRWIHPQYGMIPPDEFIELAEQTGYIYIITDWVIREGLKQLGQWHRAGLDLNLSINISATDIQNPELISLLETEIMHNKIDPSMLKLEITENSLMLYNEQTMAVLSSIAGLGIQISIDDYGTGYSSLQYLKKMPVSQIKIDRSFIMHMLKNDNDAIIVRSTINMAHNLGLEIVAEGIEDQDTHDILEILLCDYAQGYHLARPMNNSVFLEWLKQYNTSKKKSQAVNYGR